MVTGTSAANAIVNIYTDSNCTVFVGTSAADENGNFSIQVSLTSGTEATYYATAKAPGQLVSDCSSTSATFRSTSIRPGLALLAGTQTNAPSTPTKVNQATPYAIQWNSSEYDPNYYDHSISTDSHEITVKTAGDYIVAATLPLTMTAGTYRPCTRLEVRVNGTLVTGAVGESSYIRYDATGNNESSSHVAMLIENLNIDDVIEVYTQETAGQDGSEVVNISNQATLYLEYASNTRNFFTATATQTTGGTNINLGTPEPLLWVESRKDNGFAHDNGSSPQNITLDAGNYLVFVNIPISSGVARISPKVLVELDNVTVNGGHASQGYMRADSGHNDSSLHWSGMLTGVTQGAVLTIKTQSSNVGGNATIQAANAAHITIEKLASPTGVISLRGTDLTGGTNWNPAASQSVEWSVSDLADSTIYDHSISANQEQIKVKEPGDYLLIYNDALTSPSAQRSNPLIKIQVNGSNVAGAETKTHYARNSSSHQESSGSLVFLLRNLSADDTVAVTTQQEVQAGTVNDLQDAIITLIKK